MDLVEIRDLDGPNIFLLEPAIKIEAAVSAAGLDDLRDLARRCGVVEGMDDPSHLRSAADVIRAAVIELHRLAGADEPACVVRQLETPRHFAAAFAWRHRGFAMRLARGIGDAVAGGTVDVPGLATELRQLLKNTDEEDRPLWVRDADRRVRTIAVTGTNGKTTTTRLIAHVLRGCGQHVGWCSSSGVYIDGREVVQGDYSGPSGARRVLLEPGLDAGVLETARGGILLRGVAFESNDVSVFINVSADHLDLQGVRTVEGLARVKSVVVRVTKREGFAVLNADDPLVMGATDEIRAQKMLVSRLPDNPLVQRHVAGGGAALVVDDGRFVRWRGGERSTLIEAAEVPITFGGKARHMVENALCAAAACLAYGLTEDQVRSGLSSFENSPSQNSGRLNVVHVNGVTVIVDYAHNEAGLAYLLDFARFHLGAGGRLITIIGTAGDRTDHSLREIGRLAAVGSDAVIVKGTERYLRGRTFEEMVKLYWEGIRLGGKEPEAVEALELPAVKRAIVGAGRGDVVAIMAQEQVPEILGYLQDLVAQTDGEACAGSGPSREHLDDGAGAVESR
jgi:cyanophycin synthetase